MRMTIGFPVIGCGAITLLVSACGDTRRPAPQEQEKSGTTAEGDVDAKEAVAPEAEARLRAMSAHLAGLEAFTVHTSGVLEYVLNSGQTVGFPFSGDVSVRRPDRLRSDRIDEGGDLHFLYDGQTFTLHAAGPNLYAQTEAPATLDAAIDAARSDLHLEAPAADLLYADPYAVLTEDVVSGFQVGTSMIDGKPCDHLAFRGNEVDWQIWIAQGPEPLPMRYVITSKKVEGSPDFVVELSDWNTNASLGDDVFELAPPPDAKKLDFPALEKRLQQAPERKAS